MRSSLPNNFKIELQEKTLPSDSLLGERERERERERDRVLHFCIGIAVAKYSISVNDLFNNEPKQFLLKINWSQVN